MTIFGTLLTIGLLLSIYYVALRNPDRRKKVVGAARGLDAGAIGFAGVGAKLASLVIDTELADISFTLLLVTLVLAIVHARFPSAVEIGVVGAGVVILIGSSLMFGDTSRSDLRLWAWIGLVLGLFSALMLFVRAPMSVLTMSWLAGRDRESWGPLAVGLGGLVAFGFDLFDPLWRSGLDQILASTIPSWGFYGAGVLLVIATVAAPTLTAPLLGIGLIVSEVVVRGVVCASPDLTAQGADCASTILIVLIVGVFLVFRSVAARFVGRQR